MATYQNPAINTPLNQPNSDDGCLIKTKPSKLKSHKLRSRKPSNSYPKTTIKT